MICSTFITPQQSYGQFNFSHLDSLRNNFPHDSTYSPNRMIVKFKPTTLDLEQLCFTYETVSENGKKTEGVLMTDDQYYNLRTYLAEQRFYVKDLLTDTLLANFLVSLGADTLSRMTFASPCVDTLSITRHGDTIPIQDHLFMILHFKNDTSIVMATYVLNGFFNPLLYSAVPDLILEYRARIPNDQYFGYQRSFNANYADIVGAWDFERGNPETKVAIIDAGIDYFHCEFNQNYLGDGNKVIFGWSYINNSKNITTNADHGTAIAGTIGGYSNRASSCVASPSGIAGVAGGWGDLGGWSSNEKGCSLLGYQCDVNQSSQLVAAIRDASAKSASSNSKYGTSVHIINASWGWPYNNGDRSFWIELERAISYAYEHNVVFVAAKANEETILPDMPSGGEFNKVFSVSSSEIDKFNGTSIKTPNTGYEDHLDILAPSQELGQCGTPSDYLHYVPTKREQNISRYGCATGTSFATPLVAGTCALLHARSLDKGWKLYPEDYEGIIKVSATDINHSSPYSEHYDTKSGWGVLNAKEVFNKIDVQKYELTHYTVNYNENFEFGEWSNWFDILFDADNTIKKDGPGPYHVRRRRVYYSSIHQTEWKDAIETDNNNNTIDYKIYVWGNGGADHSVHAKKGFGLTNQSGVNFQTGYTGVVSGYGGGDWQEKESNFIHDYGYHHGDSHHFRLITYQYEVRRFFEVLNYLAPNNEDLAMHYSVFGVPITTSTSEKSLDKSFTVFPSIATNQIKVDILDRNINNNIKVMNANALTVFETNVLGNSAVIDLSNLSVGMYFVFVNNDKSKMHKFIIFR